jgi:hypothetical protein
MRIIVLSPFSSQFNPKVAYEKGQVYDFPEARAKELIAGGFAEDEQALQKLQAEAAKAEAEKKAAEAAKKAGKEKE